MTVADRLRTDANGVQQHGANPPIRHSPGHGVGVDRFHKEVLSEWRPTALNGVFLLLAGGELPALLVAAPAGRSASAKRSTRSLTPDSRLHR